MKLDKSFLTGSTSMLILKLLDEKDMYGYQMIEELSRKSNDIFHLKAGTLYPLLHNLEQQGMIDSYDKIADNAKTRKYYAITGSGKKAFADKKAEWKVYAKAVDKVLKGGVTLATN